MSRLGRACMLAFAVTAGQPNARLAPPPPCSRGELAELARRDGLPEPLVFAMAYADSRFQLAPENPERRTCIRPRATALASLAAAARLDAGAPLDRWQAALARWHGSGDASVDALYADEVVRLAREFATSGDARQLPSRTAAVVAAVTLPAVDTIRPAGFVGDAAALYVPGSANARRREMSARPIRYIVIHTTENTLPAVLPYLRAASCTVGAHYLVRASDGLILQLADERAVVFHDACFNQESIGIEHEGYVDDRGPWFSDEMYRASAALVRRIARRYGIPLDRRHILGHGETPDCSSHSDPGARWDWQRYMRYVTEER